MTTTPCTWSVDWNQCANCARLKRRVDAAHAAHLAASERYSQAYDEYQSCRASGLMPFGTETHRAWQARLDNLERQVDEASATAHAAIDEWAQSIRLHHRFHVAYTRIAAAGHVDTGETTSLPETEEMPTAQSDGDDTPCTCAMCQAEDGEPTDEERAAYLAERDQCDPDDTEREERRDAARRIIADYMGVDPDDVRIICSGVFGPADEPTTPREQDPAAPATVPLAELERIIDEQTSYYEQIRDWANSRGLDASSATVALYIIDKISAQITELANDLIPQEDPNA